MAATSSPENSVPQYPDGKPSYARDLWDSHGLRVIGERVEKGKKTMRLLQTFFQDAASTALRNHSAHKRFIASDFTQMEVGSLNFVTSRFAELVETVSKNEEILSSKIRTQCYNRLNEQTTKINNTNSHLLTKCQRLHKDLDRERKKLKRSQQAYDEKKRSCEAVEKAVELERDQLIHTEPTSAKYSQLESNILNLQNKAKYLRNQAHEALESYIAAVSAFRGFRQQFDQATASILERLEHCEKERSELIHSTLNAYLEIERVMVSQSLRNIETIVRHIKPLDPDGDNCLFIERSRSNVPKPGLPDPELHPDDEADENKMPSRGDTIVVDDESPEVLAQCERWRLVIGSILGRDVKHTFRDELDHAVDANGHVSRNGRPGLTAVVPALGVPHPRSPNQSPRGSPRGDPPNMRPLRSPSPQPVLLTQEELDQLKTECIAKLSTEPGRIAFAIILNRQRNEDHGLELQREGFSTLAEITKVFLDHAHDNMHVKPAKLVMIMSQSLYVRKKNVLDLLTEAELAELQESRRLSDGDGTHRRQASYLPKRDKLFLVDRIKNHPLWVNERFWEEAFYESVQTELKKYPPIRRYHSPQEQEEGQRRNQQILFGQLAAWTHNMKEFGMEPQVIRNFLDKQAQLTEIPREQVDVLLATLEISDTVDQNIIRLTDQLIPQDDDQSILSGHSGQSGRTN